MLVDHAGRYHGAMAKSRSKPAALECFDNPCPGRVYVIEHVAEEFTSLCPKTGHPDYGVVTVRYVPGQLCVELKSLKLYYQSFRNKGIFYEAVTNQILDDLVAATAPKWMMIQTEWRGRGGIRSTIRIEFGTLPNDACYDDELDDDDATPRMRPGEDDDIDSRPPPGFAE